MKKVILSVALVLGCLTFANAQQNALGLKYGGEWNNHSTYISYQRFLSEISRLEMNLGVSSFNFDVFTANAIFQRVRQLQEMPYGFKWHFGIGAGVAFGEHIDFGLSLLGNIGIEYNLHSVPLQLALDYTPSMSITPSFGNTHFGEGGARFSARWRF